MASVYPLLSRQLAADRAAGRADAATRPRARSSRFGVPLAAGGLVIAPELARLAGGDEFAAAADPLRLLLCAAVLAYLSGLLGYALIAGGLERATLWLVASPRSSLNLALNVALAPAYGADGVGRDRASAARRCCSRGGWLLVRRRLGLRPALRRRVARRCSPPP